MIDKHRGAGFSERSEPDEGAVIVEVASPDDLLAVDTEVLDGPAFDENLAKWLTEDEQRRIVDELSEAFDSDDLSRADWIRTYKNGLDLLGVKIEERNEPWCGACGVTHPMILESAVRFQSKASVRLFPSRGPAQVRVYGAQPEDVLAASRRVAHDLNYYCTEKMPEYFSDTETLLFHLPVAGSAFRKVYFDASLGRPCAHFIDAADFVMPAGFPNLETCPRYTELLHTSHSAVRRLAAQGYYLPFDTDRLATPDLTEVEEKEAQLTGFRPSSTHSELVTLCEMHTDLELPQFDEDAVPLPYVITWVKHTAGASGGKLLSIRRNWREADSLRRKILHFVHYRYVPGLDSYGWGLIHLIGGLAKGTTSILRQLVDAGTLANLLGGFKSRQFRVKGEDKPIAPGEWRDVDLPGGKISEGLFPLPYKEPSTVLMNLYNSLVAEGKEFASIADLDISTASANAPVGTILALIERASEVITAVQSRLHASFKQELNLLTECIREYDSDAYDYEVEGQPRSIKRTDYARRYQIRPVSDPSTATTAQRVMQLQAAMQFSAQAPQIYDVPKLHREMLATLGVDPPEDLVPAEETTPLDPVSENMAIITSKPVKAFEYQDHAAHIAVHQTAMEDPGVQQMLASSPLAGSIQGAASAHLAEHIAMEYRKQIEEQMGVPLPPMGVPLPPEIEEQLAGIQAQAATKLAQKRAAEAQQKEAQAKQDDPVFQLEQQKLKLEEAKLQQKDKKEQAELQIKAQHVQAQAAVSQATAQGQQMKAQSDAQIAQSRLQSEQQRTALESQKLQAEAAAIQQTAQAQQQAAMMKAQAEQARVQGQQQEAVLRAETERELALVEQATRQEQIAAQERIAAMQTSQQRDQQADQLRLDQQKLQAELAEMRQQMDVAVKKLANEEEKLRVERERISSQERMAAAERRHQSRMAKQKPKQPEGGGSDAGGEA